MIDPKDPNFDHEAATLVPDGRSSPPAPKNTAVQTPPPDSSSPESSEAPTMLEGALPPLPPITRPNVAGGRVTPVTPIPPGSTFAGLMLPPGTVLGNRYEILQILGEGGMGAVYKARDIELDRVMALKVIRPELASNPEILQRFKQELILARQVTDRNVIRIFDLGEADGIKFITMEYVEGESLYQILKREGKVPVAEAVDIMKQMLGGLLAAHREGVIHRDLKPGNVMRDAQGRVVVMDFGLARSFAGDGMTRTGAMLGTMEYMSPEQAQAKELDARSDLFTVGLILLRTADRQNAVPGRQRGRQPDQAQLGAGHSDRRPGPYHSDCAEQHREQVPGARSQPSLSECYRVAARPGSVGGQSRRRNTPFSACG